MKERPEILAPAGSLSCLKAAVAAGADAVYFGGQAFNARRSAKGFTKDDVREAVRLCRMRGVKTNLTLNTLVKEQEWPALLSYMDEILPLGVDAVIVQDLGIYRAIRRYYPDVLIHASTQMAVQDLSGAVYLQELGFDRVVLAREVTLEEIRQIRRETDMELEVFVHGALCYSYSGRCLLSSFHGGRSGNRGACAQPCRLAYRADGWESGYFMNLKDLCGAEQLQALIEAGVSSLKIEGRLKSEAYVAGVTGFYRQLMDEYGRNGQIHKIRESELQPVKQLFNRGGFSGGYYLTKQNMIERGTPKHQGIPVGRVAGFQNGRVKIESTELLHSGDELEIRSGNPPYPSVRLAASMLQKGGKAAEFYLKAALQKGQEVWRIVDPVLQQHLLEKAAQLPKVPVSMAFWAKIGERAVLKSGGCTVYGDVVSRAQTKALTKEAVAKQLKKTGDLGFEVTDLEIQLEEDCFLPVSALNQLRRELLERLAQPAKRERAKERPLEEPEKMDAGELADMSCWVGVDHPQQWEVLSRMEHGRISVVLPRLEGFEKADKAAFLRLAAGKRIVPQLPPVGRLCHEAWITKEIRAWQALGVMDFEANLMGQVRMIEALGGRVWAGPHLAVMNRQAAAFWQERAQSVMLSWELTGREMRGIGPVKGAYFWAYGRIPYMVSEQCVYREAKGCHKQSEGHLLPLEDRKGERMTVRSHCALCYSEILSEKPVFLADRKEALAHPRLELTLESASQVRALWKAVLERKRPEFPVEIGHWEKGVE